MCCSMSINQHTQGLVTMKLSKIISDIALGNSYNSKALEKCLNMNLILKLQYRNAIQRYLNGSHSHSDSMLLQDISVALHKIGA
jgi:hypothetical protein